METQRLTTIFNGMYWHLREGVYFTAWAENESWKKGGQMHDMGRFDRTLNTSLSLLKR